MEITTRDDCEIFEHLEFETGSAIGARARIGLVVLATDYTIEHEFRRIIIRKRGFEVPVFGSFNEEHDPTVAAIDGDSLRRAISKITDGREVDAVFVSCTGVRLVDAIAEIEADSGLPVTSSNHAMAWHCLRLAGVNNTLPGLGRLFELTL
jgi:maleate isomerase